MESKVTPINIKSLTKKGFQLVEIDPMKLEIHTLANINPMMPNDQYAEFIKQFIDGFNKDISHIVLFKGKVVDGRHRTKACKELGINLWARNLPSSMTTEEVVEFVEGTENRRHQTITQRAIGAYKYYLQKQEEGTPVSQSIAATKKLSSRRQLARAATLGDLIGMELLNVLYNGGKLTISSDKGHPITTDVLLTLINYFTVRNAEMTVETPSNNPMTDRELVLVDSKAEELKLECSQLVLNAIAERISK